MASSGHASSEGSSGYANSEGMNSLLQNFMNAKDIDDQSSAFQKLRSYVTKSRRIDPSSLSDGVSGTCMSTFLEMLVVFAEKKRILLDQVHELINHLAKSGGTDWQKHMATIRVKLDKLSSSRKSSSRASTSASSSDEDPSRTLSSSSDGLKEDDCVEIVSRSKVGRVMGNDNGLLRVDLLDGTMCTVPASDLRRFDRDSIWVALNPNTSEPAGRLAQSHDALSKLLSLLLVTAGDESRKARLNEVKFAYNKEWARLLTDKDLHYVIAGLVSSGKTTLANSLLAHSIPQKWKGDMLPSAALENTSAVTMFAFNAKMYDQICAKIETVRLTGQPDGEASSYESHADPSSMTLSSVTELQEKILPLLGKLTGAKDAFKRLVVEIPYPLNVIPGIHEKTFGIDPSEVLVDTPGLDSPGLKEHLVSILAQKCFLYGFIVNVESASPFGNHGFELLQFLTRNVEMMFPPVIIFTKFKLLEEASYLRTWKMANPGGLEKRLKDLVNRTLDKLEEAGIPHCPFFADVDALWASRDSEELPDFKDEIEEAQEGLSEFFKDLVCLGRNIATPIHQCRLLELQNQTTQDIINEIHREDGQRLLEGRDLDDLKKLGKKLKEEFSENVNKYFNVEWTDRGILQYQPPPPFNRDTCAITSVPAEFRKVFQSYKKGNESIKKKNEAVRTIVEETNKRVLSLIAADLGKYEADALERFKVTMWQKMGVKDMDLSQHLKFSLWQRLVGAYLGASAVSFGIQVAADTVAASAVAASATTFGYAALAGTGAFAFGLALCAAFVYKDEWGAWTWEGAEKASWEALLDACSKNCPKVTSFVKKGFNKKVDEILRKIEEHRSVPSPETSNCEAAQIQSSAQKNYKHVTKQLQEILKSKKERWLGKKGSTLEKICKEVLEERQSKESKSSKFTLSMGAMSC